MPEAAVRPDCLPFAPEGAPPAGHKPRPRHAPGLLDVALIAAREYADHYYPDAREVALTIIDAGGRRAAVQVPPAGVLDRVTAGDRAPLAVLKYPGCAVAVLAALLAAGGPMTGPAIREAIELSGTHPAYALSSVEKALAELMRIGLLTNPAGVRPKGYRLAAD